MKDIKSALALVIDDLEQGRAVRIGDYVYHRAVNKGCPPHIRRRAVDADGKNHKTVCCLWQEIVDLAPTAIASAQTVMDICDGCVDTDTIHISDTFGRIYCTTAAKYLRWLYDNEDAYTVRLMARLVLICERCDDMLKICIGRKTRRRRVCI